MLLLNPGEREQLWRSLIDTIENHIETVTDLPVSPKLDVDRIRSLVEACDFRQPAAPSDALRFAANGMREFQVHCPHPRYFGLFNPAPATMGIAADALVAAFNPNMAAWSHSPFANEIERHVILSFAKMFGYDPAAADGVFASGGAEANHTALLAALTQHFPKFREQGARSLAVQPVFYVSSEAHHSLQKAAGMCGIGTAAVHSIPADSKLRIDCTQLVDKIKRDRAAGLTPFMLVATAGTTNAGVVDPIASLAEIALSEGLWLHLDAAWAGVAALLPEFESLFAGASSADSITFDAHKWLSAPMGAGVFLTRHREILAQTFGTPNQYMPREAAGLPVEDNFGRSMQWSRRFIGLKVFLTLYEAGWDGIREMLRHTIHMGALLRQRLSESGWTILNDTPLPVVCFSDSTRRQGDSAEHLQAILRKLLASGEAWISSTVLGGTQPALRACITNYRTQPEDVEALVTALDRARKSRANE